MQESTRLLCIQALCYVVICIFFSENLAKRSKMSIIKPRFAYAGMCQKEFASDDYLLFSFSLFSFSVSSSCCFFSIRFSKRGHLLCIVQSLTHSILFAFSSLHLVLGSAFAVDAYRRYFISIKSSHNHPTSISHIHGDVHSFSDSLLFVIFTQGNVCDGFMCTACMYVADVAVVAVVVFFLLFILLHSNCKCVM